MLVTTIHNLPVSKIGLRHLHSDGKSAITVPPTGQSLIVDLRLKDLLSKF